VGEVAELEAEENALLDPGVDAPADRARRVGLRRARFTRGQRAAQPRKHLARRVTIGRRPSGDKSFDVGFQHIGHWSLVVGRWSLVVGHWSLVIGHWSLVVGRWSLVVGHCADGSRPSRPGTSGS